MVLSEKEIKLQALEVALQELDRIIETLQSKNYAADQLNDYIKKRWAVWNEIHQVKKQ